jgi:hypothetical protein
MSRGDERPQNHSTVEGASWGVGKIGRHRKMGKQDQLNTLSFRLAPAHLVLPRELELLLIETVVRITVVG